PRSGTCSTPWTTPNPTGTPTRPSASTRPSTWPTSRPCACGWSTRRWPCTGTPSPSSARSPSRRPTPTATWPSTPTERAGRLACSIGRSSSRWPASDSGGRSDAVHLRRHRARLPPARAVLRDGPGRPVGLGQLRRAVRDLPRRPGERPWRGCSMKTLNDWHRKYRSFTVRVAENIGPRTDEDGWEHYAYKLEVTFRRRKMTMDWKHGLGVTDYPEDVPTHILDAMVSDYWTWKNANGYEDYCSEFGL